MDSVLDSGTTNVEQEISLSSSSCLQLIMLPKLVKNLMVTNQIQFFLILSHLSISMVKPHLSLLERGDLNFAAK